MVSFVIIFRNTVHTKNMRKYEKQMRKEKKPVVKWMLVWVKIRKGGNFKIQKVLVGARSINNINTFLIFYLPPRYKCPFKKTPPPPFKIPLFYSRAYKNNHGTSSQKKSFALSLSYYLCTIYILLVMNISISEHFAYLLWATNLA